MNPSLPTAFIAGGASWDTIIDLDSFPEPKPETLFARHYYEAVGGPGAGKALNLERLGFNVLLHVVLGQDHWGERIQQRFQRTRIQLLTDIDPQGTERHTNLMSPKGERISIYTHAASPIPGIDPEHLGSAIRHSDYVVLNIMNYCRRLIPQAKSLGKPIWCDLQDYDGENAYHNDFIAAADYLFMSDDKLSQPKKLMSALIDAGKQLVVCTQGARGALALNSKGEWAQTAACADATLTDCNGAGDAFFAGFLFAHHQGLSLQQSLQVASRVACFCIASHELVATELSCANALQDLS